MSSEPEDRESRPAVSGFAGLLDQVSDIDAELAAAASLPPVRQSSPEPPHQPARPQPAEVTAASADSRKTGWSVPPFVWVALAVGAALIIGFAGRSGTDRSASGYAPDYADAVSSPAVTGTADGIASPATLSETKPPAGDNLDLNVTEISYCLAEKIRISAGEGTVNGYNGAQIDQFNAWVSDYNLRCGAFRYRDSAMNTARGAVEAHRLELEQAGRARVAAIRPVVTVPIARSPGTIAQPDVGTRQYEDLPDTADAPPDESLSGDASVDSGAPGTPYE